MLLVLLHGRMKNRFPGAREEFLGKTFPSQAGRARRGRDGALQVHPGPAVLLPLLHLVGFYFFSLQHFLMMKKQAGWASGEERCSSEEKDKELLQIFMYRKSKGW